jgi:hypothetical protein
VAPTETIKWVAVPNGVDSSGNLLLSVMVAPELAGGATGTLADFPDFQDWPTALSSQAAKFTNPWIITFTDGAGNFLGGASAPFALFDSKNASPLWKDLFSPSTEYGPRPAQDPYRAIAVASYPAGHISDFLLGQYGNYKPDEVPTLQALNSVYGPISSVLVGVSSNSLGARNAHFDKLAAERAAKSQGGTVPAANNFVNASPVDAFAAHAYYHLPGLAPPPPPGIESVDFHRALTFIGQHGLLQRVLGLVFDISIPFINLQGAPLFPSPSSDVFMSVKFGNSDITFIPTGVTYAGITPRTHCYGDHSNGFFEAQPATANIARGRQLAVVDTENSNNHFHLAHVIDLDGAGLRASNFATQVQLAQTPAAIEPTFTAAFVAPDVTTTPMMPPMIRSVGLTLTEVDRGVNFAASLSRAFLLVDAADALATAIVDKSSAPPVPDLTAEDLVRGYVLDVLDHQNDAWLSTAERLPTYTFGSPATALSPSGSFPVNRPHDEASSQAPPRSQSSPTDASSQQANVSEVILRYNGWSNAVPRPGTVLQDDDSQANSSPAPFTQLSIDVSAPAGSLAPLRFGHTYAMRARIVDVANNAIPVNSPLGGLVSNDPFGRVTALMVYGRHEAIGSPDIYPQSTPRLAESLMRLVIRDVDGSATSKRALAPQRCAEPFAEWHGVFDSSGTLDPHSNNAIPDHTIYNLITGRESAHYPEPATPPTAPISLTTPVPYLPDPLARGGVFTIIDGAISGQGLHNGQAIPFEFAPSGPLSAPPWPDYKPFGLVLAPGTSQSVNPGDPSTNRVVTFTITPADTVTVQLNSTCDPTDIQFLALADLTTITWGGSFDPAAAAAGAYWAITPFVTLELIYAVQKPLLTPEFPNFPTPPRQVGDTFAPLEADLHWSPKSTSKIDLHASWGEPIDDPVHKLPVQGPGAPTPALRQTTNSPVVSMPSTVTPLTPPGTQEAAVTDRFSARHEFHDTKHRNVTYSATATSLFTEFYAPGTKVTVDTANPVTVNILSSARPDTAKIAYVVPIYGWKPIKHAGHQVVSERSPSALRVFIHRPWWSSGIDELLGVVTWPDAENRIIIIPSPALRRHRSAQSRRRGVRKDLLLGGGGVSTIPSDQALYVTDWGADPVFSSSPLPSAHPRMSTFTNATAFGTGLPIEEHPSIQVNVAGHPVHFDPKRQLWYADIAIDTGATYTPMIRLAVARYQPNSVAGVELSRIVLADIMSLEPGRTVTIVRGSSKHLTSVTLSGYSYSRAAGDSSIAPGVAEVVIERRVPGVKDATVGWEQVGQPIRMSPVSHRRLRLGSNDHVTSWVASDIALPPGKCRLAISQYELLPTDNREPRAGFYLLPRPSRDVRLLFQDVIPL